MISSHTTENRLLPLPVLHHGQNRNPGDRCPRRPGDRGADSTALRAEPADGAGPAQGSRKARKAREAAGRPLRARPSRGRGKGCVPHLVLRSPGQGQADPVDAHPRRELEEKQRRAQRKTAPEKGIAHAETETSSAACAAAYREQERSSGRCRYRSSEKQDKSRSLAPREYSCHAVERQRPAPGIPDRYSHLHPHLNLPSATRSRLWQPGPTRLDMPSPEKATAWSDASRDGRIRP